MRYRLDLPSTAKLRYPTRDTRLGALWVAAARPRAVLRINLPELRPKLR